MAFFASSVAISGTTAVVGAQGFQKIGGSVFVFDTTSGAQTAWLSTGNRSVSTQFGVVVAASNASAIVGVNTAGENEDASDLVYLFKRHCPLSEPRQRKIAAPGRASDFH